LVAVRAQANPREQLLILLGIAVVCVHVIDDNLAACRHESNLCTRVWNPVLKRYLQGK
jgi:hypothetical protein